MALIADTYNWNISKSSKALKDLVEKDNVIIHETPDEYFEEYITAARKVLDKYAKKDPFFKKVLTSMEEWAKLTVPYQTYNNGVYYKMGKNAMDKGLVRIWKK